MGPFIQEQGQSDYLVSCIGKEVTVYGYIKWASWFSKFTFLKEV